MHPQADDLILDDGDAAGYESPPLYFPASPTPPHLEGVTASALGSPRSPEKDARIRHAEWSAMLLEERLEEELGLGMAGDFYGGLDSDRDSVEGSESEGENGGYAGSAEGAGLGMNVGIEEEVVAAALRNDQPCDASRSFTIPEHKREENEPDPFYAPPKIQTSSGRRNAHPDGGVYMLYALVAWLHSQFHVPFRACNAVLLVVALIIQCFGAATSAPILTTLPSVLNRLGVEPSFRVLPVCPHCFEVYPEKPKAGERCTLCNTNLFKTGRTRGGKERTSQEPVPELKYPYKSLAEQLAEIVALPGMEDELDQWRQQNRKHGKYSDFFDGGIARDLKGHDGHPFFSNHGLERMEGPDGELRIGLTLGADW